MSMGFAGGMGGSAGGGLFGIASAGISYASQKNAQKRAAEISRNMMLNRYVWSRMGLEKAGFNPILAVSQPPPAPSVGVPGFPSTPDLSASAARGQEMIEGHSARRQEARLKELGISQAKHMVDKASWSAKREMFLSELAREQNLWTASDRNLKNAQEEQLRMVIDRDRPSAKTIGEFDASTVGQFRTKMERWLDALPNINLFGGVTGPLPSWKKKGGKK